MDPTLSIVIVNYNARDYLEHCLRSLEAQTFRDFEVIVVDNASRDGSLSAAECRTWVHLVKNTENRGFAAAQNQGMRLASGEYWMPLNFDIHLTPDFLAATVAALQTHPSVGTVSGKLMRMQPDGIWTNELDNAGLLLDRRRMPRHRGKGEQDAGQYEQRDLVFGAMGAAAVFKREMLEDVAFQGQYFDESFFTWYEDIDLDWRGRLRGWDCLYLPEAVAYHVGDPQKNQLTAFASRITIRNRWEMILANECPHCMARDARWLLSNELELLRHVIKFKRFPTYLQAMAGVVWHLPGILSKRRWVRSRALRPCLPDYPQPFQE